MMHVAYSVETSSTARFPALMVRCILACAQSHEPASSRIDKGHRQTPPPASPAERPVAAALFPRKPLRLQLGPSHLATAQSDKRLWRDLACEQPSTERGILRVGQVEKQLAALAAVAAAAELDECLLKRPCRLRDGIPAGQLVCGG
eukprot:CAMPEP_0181240666 /NCGR_PEP_ID=MMETSP1096-20121128/40664_1 /TAXON_ID=156174 ORGANISM="Chrysochromulina ericina, Strain CCMP281" /NCGR_SAMPLE_ID=MMETSP1096 /ASSEMBLY_ACC=CAM_ASM_000453 /LENGTH=145 /DNA_ID=CAMNT_0023336595 /DNA_START=232 /DNA_END=666 /DNA_ORIENTATION=-